MNNHQLKYGKRMWLRKLLNTISMLHTLFMARMFGEYIHSIGDAHLEYAVYKWGDKYWAIPSTDYTPDPRY